MITITEQTLIKRKVSEVFEFISDYENDIKWRNDVIEVKQSTKGFTIKGTVTKEKINLFGVKYFNTARITEYNGNSKIAFEIINGFSGGKGYRSVIEKDGMTQFEYSISFELNGFKRIMVKLLLSSYRNKINNDLEKLKIYLESINHLKTAI